MEPIAILVEYLNAIYRFRLVSACALVIGLITTAWTVRSLPDVYGSTTLIMIEPQDVPETYVKSTVNERFEARLQALNQEVMSRTRLEAIINDFDLFSELRQRNVPQEAVVEAMRKKISIQVFPKDYAFRISYEGEDPATVQRVTARLAGLYIDENLRIREQHVSGTTEFIESELDKVRKRLEQQEAKIQSFKQQYMGELPEQREANMHALEGLRVQLQTNSLALSSALERKLLLDKQAAEVRASRAVPAGPGGAAAGTASPSLRLRQLEATLTELRGRYKDEHPDLVNLQAQIQQLRADLGTRTGDESPDVELPPDLARSLAQVRLDIKRLQDEENSIRGAIEAYQQRIENAFVREQELQILTRDYDVTNQKYQTLLGKKLEAQLSQSLERRQKGERFRVLDPANLPEVPSRPNRRLLVGAGTGMSLALALGLPILLWRLDPSFRRPEEITSCAMPILAVIPRLSTADVRRRRRRYRARVLSLSAVALVVTLGGSFLYARYVF